MCETVRLSPDFRDYCFSDRLGQRRGTMRIDHEGIERGLHRHSFLNELRAGKTAAPGLARIRLSVRLSIVDPEKKLRSLQSEFQSESASHHLSLPTFQQDGSPYRKVQEAQAEAWKIYCHYYGTPACETRPKDRGRCHHTRTK